MRAHGVVVTPPTFDDDLGFLQRVDDFAAEQLIAKFRAEAFAISILPRSAGHDVGGLGSDRCDPFAHRRGHELRTIVRTNVSGNAAQDEQIREHVADVNSF